MNKIKKEELEKIKSQATKTNQLLNEVGYLESRKHQLLHDLAGLNEEIDIYKQELEKTYGQVTINLEDGSFEEIEKVENV
tara:strand:+ start:395 stop:634 length:240 start_codon:yes stop_codon:yes gene_type:complete